MQGFCVGVSLIEFCDYNLEECLMLIEIRGDFLKVVQHVHGLGPAFISVAP